MDQGYNAIFDKIEVKIIHKHTSEVAWKGTRNQKTGLWELPLQK